MKCFSLLSCADHRCVSCVWLEQVWSEQRRPGCLLSILGRLWSANSIVSEGPSPFVSLWSLQPPRDAFTRIYKVCNLPCVGFLIFWIAEIKHAAHLQGILFDSHAASFVPDNNWSQPPKYPHRVVKCSRVTELSLWLAFISRYLQNAIMRQWNRETAVECLSFRGNSQDVWLVSFHHQRSSSQNTTLCQFLHICIIVSFLYVESDSQSCFWHFIFWVYVNRYM